MGKPVKVFLAHAFEDKEQVREIYRKLKEAGLAPWLDEIDLIPGQNWQAEIPKAIRQSDIFVACLSKPSVKKQGYIQKEYRLALNIYAEKPAGSIYLIPLKLDDCEVPDLQIPQLGVNLRDIHWLDYWRPNGFDQLLRAIQSRSTEGEFVNDDEDEGLSHLKKAVVDNNANLVNQLLKKVLWKYAGNQAMLRGYIETLDEADRIPCAVLKRIEQLFAMAGERDGHFYCFKTYSKHPGQAWGGDRAGVWLGRTIGYRLDECGIDSYKE